MSALILVTGGTGRLGRFVVARLVDEGREVRVLARHVGEAGPRVRFFVGDLVRDRGLDVALRDVAVVVNCATSARGDARATANLVAAATRAGSPHLVQPSIVGIDSMTQWGYVKTKLDVERIVETSDLPWTIIRSTQFYNYCSENSRSLARFPFFAPVPRDFRVQPVDSRDVAARLAELALGEPAGRVPDISGPEVSSWEELFRSYLAATHQRKRVLPIPVPGGRAVRDGALLPPPDHVEGARTWDQFLAEELAGR